MFSKCVTVLLTFMMATQVTSASSSWICSASSDNFLAASKSNIDDTLRRLEEQVKQLQRLVDNKAPMFSTIQGFPRDCEEILENGTRTDGVYAISPDGRCPFFVYCDLTNGGWTVIQRRIDGEVNFIRPWDDYVAGFGTKEGEHWLGLQKIHRLTRDGSQIYFDTENYDGTKEYAHYKVFTVHDAATKYKMNVDAFGYSGTLKELFSSHNNMMFSTHDRDNDAHKSSCVSHHGGGGWWFHGCYDFGAFNGIYGKNDTDGISYHDDDYRYIKNVNIRVKLLHGQCEVV